MLSPTPGPGNARRPTPAEWQEKVPDLKQTGSQLQGPCPNCGGTDRFHVNLTEDHRFGCRQCKDGAAILRAVFGDQSGRRNAGRQDAGPSGIRKAAALTMSDGTLLGN